MRRFRMLRTEDETGVSGIGFVAEGCTFSNGQVVLAWVTKTRSLAVYDSMEDLVVIHGHDGKTQIVWVDGAAEITEQYA